MDEPTTREAERDRRRQIRDAMLCAMDDAGQPLSPHELALRLGLTLFAVTIAATRSPRYFVVIRDGKRVVSIDRHPHLKIVR